MADPFGVGTTTGTHFSGGASDPFGAAGKTGGGTAAPKKTGGILGLIEQTGKDLYHAAVNTPAGIYYLGKGLATHPLGTVETIAKSTAQDFRHPLRHPGNTLLDLLGVASAGAGTAARIGAVSKALEEGATAGEVAKAALTRVEPGPRVHQVGEMKVRGDYSRSALTRSVQKATDRAGQKAVQENPTGRTARLYERRTSKALQLNTRYATEAAKGPAAALRVLGHRLKPEEQTALKVVANEAPLDARIATVKSRLAAAKSPAEAKRHQERLTNLTRASKFLATDAKGLPAIHESFPKLQHVMDRLREVAKGREDLLQKIDALAPEGIATHKSEVLRNAQGLPLRDEGALPLSYGPETIHETPTAALTRRAELLDKGYQKLVDAAMGGKPGDYKATTGIQNARNAKAARAGRPAEYSTVKQQLRDQAEQGILETIRRNPDHPAVKALKAKLDEVDAIRAELARRGDVSVGLEKGRAGPEAAPLPEASPAAAYVPEKVTRRGVKTLGKTPGLGQQGTIGHTRAPVSLTAGYTGKAAQHALERQDTTTLVAEANLEAQKYGAVLHLKSLLKGAGHKIPQRADDVFMRLDNMKPGDTTPLAVRKFIDNPGEAFVPADARQGHFAQFLGEHFRTAKDMTPTDRVAFQKLADQGKGTWVSKTLLGDFAKPQAPLRATLGTAPTASIDTINNASRFAILYLKPAYAAPNLLGNVALNLVQQGPLGLARTLRDTSRLSFKYPELTAHIDALMGEGVAQSVAGKGETGSRLGEAVQGAANVWSRGVDTPFRRAAWVYEARKAGYRTPAELEKLLTQDVHSENMLSVTRRANREIIDYGRLGPKEREIVRRAVFFFPWVKGSTMYAGHFVAEHPLQAAVAGEVGKYGHEQATGALGNVPSYLEGAFPVGGKLVNPTSAAILQTPAQVADALAGLATGNASKVATLANFLTPAATLAGAEIFRRNPQTGVAYTGGTNAGSIAKQVLGNSLPQAVLYQRIHDAMTGKGGQRLYPPNVGDALRQFLIGGLAPRKYNKGELQALYDREQTQIRTGR